MKKYINPEMIFNAIATEDIMDMSVEKTEYTAGSGVGNDPLDIGDLMKNPL